MNKRKENRIEIIEDGKRAFTKWNCKIEESVQDNGRTLKLFVDSPQAKEEEKNLSLETTSSGDVKIHAEEIRKENFDKYSIDEIRDMVGWVEPPSDKNGTWDVSTADGGVFACSNQETAFIMGALEEVKAKLFGAFRDE